MSSPEAALHVKDLCKSFGRIRAVDHLSLDIHPGRMVGFLGPNGAGKSTTLYMICGLVRPTGGCIEIFGHSVRKDFKNAIRHVGTMVDTAASYDYLSGRANMKLVGRSRGASCDSQIDRILKRVGLCGRQHDKVATYSHGMKQRLGIGMALVGNPRMLILDEPTNGMDPDGTQEILGFLREKVRNDGLTVFVSSHLLYEIEEYCDSVFLIDDGTLVASGDVKTILAPHDDVVRIVFHGSKPDPQTLAGQEGIERVETLDDGTFQITLAGRSSAWLNRSLVQDGYEVSAVVPLRRTLKDFFMSITNRNNEEKAEI